MWGSPEHVMLRRARINAVQVEKGYKGKALGLPTFLLGGAFLSCDRRRHRPAQSSSAIDSKVGP